MQAETLDAIRTLIRAELRRVGLRPPPATGPGAWRWDSAAACWLSLLDAPVSSPASSSV